MQIIESIRRVKAILVIFAVIIAVSSLYISHTLVKDLSAEERLKMEVWAEAMRAINSADENTDLNLVLKVLHANNTIPVIVADANGHIQLFRNIEVASEDSISYLKKQLESLKRTGSHIRINLSDNRDYLNVYYDDSLMLTRLSVYPYVQLGVVLIFVIVAIFALLSSKKAEQNKVWVGLSKEAAHQLGTPISSLMAWTELLKNEYPEDRLIPSMSEDVERLQMIANRFSKIGSTPELEAVDMGEMLDGVTGYMAHRTSDKVRFITHLPDRSVVVKLNTSLFGWVIENLCKNAIDAMNGVGTITLTVTDTANVCRIDVEDTGKGIIKSKYKMIFTPGYTTKKRGWGLGLSLARRIVEEYHSGRIFVKQSELNRGTVFRIELKK